MYQESIIVCYFHFSEQFGLTEADYYSYLNQSGCYEVDGVDDVKEYQDTRVRRRHYTFLCFLLIPPLVVNLFVTAKLGA